jgi:hypothetical protein
VLRECAIIGETFFEFIEDRTAAAISFRPGSLVMMPEDHGLTQN